MASLLKDYVTCPVCYEIFNELDCEPQALQCLHTLCKKCLDQIATSTEFNCPQCKAMCQKETTKSDFRTKSLVSDYKREKTRTQTKKDMTSPVPKCGMCDNAGKPLKSKCVDCQLFLCPDCERAHKKIPALNSHSIETLSFFLKNLETNIKKTMLEFEKVKQNVTQGKSVTVTECGKLDKIQEDSIKKINKARKKQLKDIDDYHDGLIKQLQREKSKAQEELTSRDFQVDLLLKEAQGKIAMLSELLKKKDKNKMIGLGDATNKQVKEDLVKLSTGAESLLKHTAGLSVTVEECKKPLNDTVSTKLSIKNKTFDPSSDIINQEPSSSRIDDQPDMVPETFSDTQTENAISTNKLLYSTLVKTTPILGAGRRLRMHANKLWCSTREALHIYDINGELLESVYWQMHEEWASAVIPDPTGNQLIVSFYHSGVQLVNNEGMPMLTMCYGEFSDVTLCGQEVYALEWQEKKVVVLEYTENRWCQTGVVQLTYEGSHSCDKMHIGDDLIYVSSWFNNCIYTFTFEGDLLETYTVPQNCLALDGPKLCNLDSEQSCLIADSGNARLLWCSLLGHFHNVSLPVNIGQPEDAVSIAEDQSVWVLTYDNGYKLMKFL